MFSLFASKYTKKYFGTLTGSKHVGQARSCGCCIIGCADLLHFIWTTFEFQIISLLFSHVANVFLCFAGKKEKSETFSFSGTTLFCKLKFHIKVSTSTKNFHKKNCEDFFSAQ